MLTFLAGEKWKEALVATIKSAPDATALLVKRLQENLSRLQKVEVFSAGSGLEDEQRPSMLSRQLRLKLVADETQDIPKSCHNLVVSIHAAASFESLHDFLRPKIALSSSDAATRLSSVLAAFASSGGPSGDRATSQSTPLAESLMQGLLDEDVERDDTEEVDIIEKDAEASGPEGTETASSSSYAQIAAKSPADWHLAFTIEGKRMHLSDTIFAGVHFAETTKNPSAERFNWHSLTTVHYKKVDGPRTAIENGETFRHISGQIILLTVYT